MKDILSLFKSKPRSFYFFIFAIGALNSLINSFFLILIGKSVSGGRHFLFSGFYPLLFLILFLVSILLSYYFYRYTIRIATDIVFEVEMNLVSKIKNASFGKLAKIEKEDVYAAISGLNVLSFAPSRFILFFNSFLTVAGSIAYLFWTSVIYGTAIILLILLLMGWFAMGYRARKSKHEKLRHLQVDQYKYIADLLYGFKDLKMSTTKSDILFSQFVLENRSQTKSVDRDLKQHFSNSAMVSNYVWYVFLGLAVFVLPKIDIFNAAQTSAFVICLVYIIGPVSNITNFFQFYAGLKVAVMNLVRINTSLSEDAGESVSTIELPSFEEIQFRDVFFQYQEYGHDEDFMLGPVDVVINKGETVFIMGGNGSGKSTFLNLLAGLHKPTKGSIMYNGIKLTDSHCEAYRNKIAAVFIEGYLLTNNYEQFVLDSTNEQFMEYLKLMKLHEVCDPNEIYERKSALSKGQQKRLALLLALMMERSVLVLDEWAAEQDPVFKSYFYKTILPVLKNRGITIIVITHDEQYFDCADRIIRFREGRIVDDVFVKVPAEQGGIIVGS